MDTIVKTNHGHIPTGLIGCKWINRSVNEVTESGRPAAQAAGLKFVEISNGRAEFHAGTGTYHLLSRWPNSSR